jgi:hypothetical protein
MDYIEIEDALVIVLFCSFLNWLVLLVFYY